MNSNVRCLFCGSFMLFMFQVVCLCYDVLSVSCCLMITCWERNDAFALFCAVFSCEFVTFPMVFRGGATSVYPFQNFAFVFSFVMPNCELVTFSLVSWVRCGAWLYRFLIFALFLSFSLLLYSNKPCHFTKCHNYDHLVTIWSYVIKREREVEEREGEREKKFCVLN